MRALKHLEHMRRETLHAEGHAREPTLPKLRETCRIHRVRVRLGRHLSIAGETERRPQRIQDANEAYSPGVDGETDVDGMMKPIAYKRVVTGETQEAADYAVDILRKNGVKDASAYVTLSY